MDIANPGFALCHQPCQHHGSSGTQVSSLDSTAMQPVNALHHGGAPVNADVGAHALQLVDVHKAVLKNRLRHPAHALGHRQKRHELRLHICRKARIRQRLDVHSLGAPVTDHADAVDVFLDGDACLLQLGDDRLQMLADGILDVHIPLGHGGCHHVGACLDAVRDNGIVLAGQALDALNLDYVGTGTPHSGTHHIQVVCQVDNLRLLGRVLNDSSALCHGGCHHDVFGCSHAWEVKVNPRPLQPLRRGGFNVAVADVNPCPQCFKALQVQVNRTGADGTASRQGNLRPAAACQQRPYNKEGGTHLAHQVIRGLAAGNL